VRDFFFFFLRIRVRFDEKKKSFKLIMLPPGSLTKLFVIPESSGSRALWLYLREAQIPFVLDKVKGEDALAKCVEINQQQKKSSAVGAGSLSLPVLRDKGVTVYGAVTILRYVGTKYTRWYPEDIGRRASVDMYLEWHQNHLHKASATLLEFTTPSPQGVFSSGKSVLTRTATSSSSTSSSSSASSSAAADDADSDASAEAAEKKRQEVLTADAVARVKVAEETYRETLETMEQTFLKENEFLAGDQVTIADLAAACELAFVELLPVALADDFPKLNEWYQKVRGAFKHWPAVHEHFEQWLPDARRRQEEQRKRQLNIKRYGKDAAGGTRPPDIDHRVHFHAPLTDVYALMLDAARLSERFAAAAGGSGKPAAPACAIEARRGGSYSLYDDQIQGTVLLIMENLSLLLSWRDRDWPQHARSTVKLTFSPAADSSIAEVSLHQQDVPPAHLKRTDEWWAVAFWQPLGGVLLRQAAATIFFEHASPHMLYELLMDVNRVSKYTKTKCELNRGVGVSFSLLDSQVTGTNVELITDKKIVQLWRQADWPAASHHSTVTIELQRVAGGTDLSFKQTNIPLESLSKVNDLWDKFFWRKIKREIRDNFSEVIMSLS
jgi:activator of HSP90 ATPase